MAIEKLSDLLALMGMVVFLVGFTDLGGSTLRWIGLVGGGLTAAIMMLLLAAIFLRRQLPLRAEHRRVPGSARLPTRHTWAATSSTAPSRGR